MIVELAACHAGLDCAIQVIDIDRDDTLHPRRIDRKTAKRRVHVAFERGADPIRNNRYPMIGADSNRFTNLFGRFWKQYRVGRLVGNFRRLIAMLPAYGFTLGETLAEARTQD